MVPLHGGASRRGDRWRSVRVPAAAAGLVLLERALMEQLGSPVTLLRVLGDLGRPWADPVASVLALIGLMAEALAAYGLVVLLLQSLCMLPGFLGGLAGRLMALVTPAVVRRLLDLLVGGALLAQLTWRRPRAHRPGTDGAARRWPRPRPCPRTVLPVEPP